PEDACVRELLFTRITNLDRDDLVAAGELDQRALPVTRAAEVADDDDDRSLSRERAGAPQRRAERRRTDPCVGVVDPQCVEQADQADPPLPRRQPPLAVVAERHAAESVPPPRRDVADRDRNPSAAA